MFGLFYSSRCSSAPSVFWLITVGRVSKNQASNGIRVLKHEYGHYLHLQQIGAISYVSNVMIPSLAGAALDKLGILPDGIYYSLLWEHIAEQLGNVNHGGYTEWAHGYASAYWIWTVIVDKLV